MIGIDLVEVEKIKQGLKNENFIKKILTENEIQYINTFMDKEEHIAGFFACKEAVMKALEDCKKISFAEIEVLHYQSGKPHIVLYGEAKRVFEQKKCKNIEVSISQTENFAIAMCLITDNDEQRRKCKLVCKLS